MTYSPTYRTALIGLGRVGRAYAHDKRTARHYRYASHAQVLSAHPAFAWEAAVDPDPAALEATSLEWEVPHIFRDVEEMARIFRPDVAVIATPPEVRFEVIRSLPGLRAAVVEKPLAANGATAAELVDHCREQGIALQVNLSRRFDRALTELAGERLTDCIGTVQAAFGLYGNGLRNNGVHLIDMVRMLLGEVVAARALGQPVARSANRISGDVDLPFSLTLDDGVVVCVGNLDFSYYREVALDVWGAAGRLEFFQEGLTVRLSRATNHRAIEAEREVASDRPETRTSGAGTALYALYDNLADALAGQAELSSPGTSALVTERVVDALIASADADGARMVVADFQP